MKPVMMPFAERLGRFALNRAGVRSRWVHTAQGKVHVYDAAGKGSLPTLVLLHGIGSAGVAFGSVVTRLQRDFRRIVVPDYPGHGFSEEPTVRLTPDALFESVSNVIDELVDEPSFVVGNSLGGALTMHYAITRPERVRGIVLFSPAGAQSTDDEWGEIRRVFDVTNRARSLEFLNRLYHRTPWFMPLVAHELPGALRRRAVCELLESATNEHVPTSEALAAIKTPMLFVWGRSEKLLPAGHLDYFRKHLPAHAEVERPVGFGHCPHFDAPGQVARRIVRFAQAHASSVAA